MKLYGIKIKNLLVESKWNAYKAILWLRSLFGTGAVQL